jgi:uncharacterized membrane protein YfcA
MLYTAEEILLVAVVMTIGSVLQGAIGFASGLMGVPMLVLCGFSLIEATVINFISTTVQNFTGAIQLRQQAQGPHPPHSRDRRLQPGNLPGAVGATVRRAQGEWR